MEKGEVKWFDDQKGFGFIKPDSGGKDLFVHHTDIDQTGHKTLAEGQKVEFETVSSQKGLKAVAVHVSS